MITRVFSFLVITIIAISCGVNYSFTGISTDAKSVSIQYFPIGGNAALAPPTYSQEFTEALKDIFIQQTSMELLNRGGELQFEGEVVGYTNTPTAIQSTDQAAQNRLTITVNVRFVNTLDETQNFEQRFSRFVDYNSSLQLAQVESQLTQEVNEQLTQDILSRAIGNW